ncbi:MAG: DNA repair protein RadA [Myxococcales bacterium]
MAKAARAAKVEHVCTGCGFRTSRWLGRCPGCGEWASIVEECGAPGVADAVGIDRVPAESGERLSTGIGELDRVLGGGLVPGAVVLLAGEPGIGKSTLLLAALDRLARQEPDRAVLYVSGEESLAQIRMRGERLDALSPGLLLRSDSSVADALAAADRLRPLVLAVDSVQTLHVAGLDCAAGSVTQVRDVAARLVEWAKRTGTPTLLVGHVTKDGGIAGPRVLEHLVDAVLSFEGDHNHAYRILRACKNRFGSTNEIGVFEMKGKGLEEVKNPSALFLAERPRGSSGSVVAAVMNGTRPLLVEVQALVADAASGGSARRTAIGVDNGRVALLTAVLERKQGIVLCDQDIYVNVAGGASLDEPAADLAVAAALVSSFRDVPLDPRTVVFGEVGLSGEVRGVTQVEQRLGEAAQLGFVRCILPESNARRLGNAPLELCGVGTVGAAMEALILM